MKKASDGVPELVVENERSKRSTTEFCGDSQDGYRCMLLKDHTGMHESLMNEGLARWPSSRAS